MSDIQHLHKMHEKEDNLQRQFMQLVQLKFLVTSWKTSVTDKRPDVARELEIQIEDQITNIKKFDPNFSFEEWLKVEY